MASVTVIINGVELRTKGCDSIVARLQEVVDVAGVRFDTLGQEEPVTIIADHPEFGRCTWKYSAGVIDGPTVLEDDGCPGDPDGLHHIGCGCPA